MASTRPSATTWRARSWLVQWVRWSPSATGSRQANSTNWARCKGGKLLGTSQARVIEQESAQPTPLIATADAPDGCRVTFQPAGKGGDGFSQGNAQHDAGMLDLE